MYHVWWWCKKCLLTLVERGGAVYVSWDEGGLRLLPHSVVPHPPDAALGWEKSSDWSGLNMVPMLFKAFGPEDWMATWVCDSQLHLFTRFNYPTAPVKQCPSRAISNWSRKWICWDSDSLYFKRLALGVCFFSLNSKRQNSQKFF